MIHYLNAGMAEDADKRAEEADFMSGFVPALDPVDVFPCTQVQMRKVFAAFRALLAVALARAPGQHLITK